MMDSRAKHPQLDVNDLLPTVAATASVRWMGRDGDAPALGPLVTRVHVSDGTAAPHNRPSAAVNKRADIARVSLCICTGFVVII